MRRLRRTSAALVAGYLALTALAAVAVWLVAWSSALDGVARRAEADLALASNRLAGELGEFRQLAVLMADHPTIRMPVEIDLGEATAARLLRETADKTGALDLILLDTEGREIATASARAGLPAETGVDDAAYLRALDGALGFSHEHSARYERRIFTFAAPIFGADGPAIGALAVVADAERVEAIWRGDTPAVWFTDEAGLVFISNRSELVLRGRGAGFVPYQGRIWDGHELWRVEGGRYLPRDGLHLSRDMPVIGLTAEALSDTALARQIALLQSGAVAALFLGLGALLLVATVRRRTLKEANRTLEGRVVQRTAELTALNAELRREVAERAAAEARLKRAQDDLVQAGKLSALGQMSAGISHELNQPLMAIRSYAENATGFLARGKPDVAAANLERIASLAQRMGKIIRNLRAFARQEKETIGDVDLVAAVDSAVEMIAARVREEGVALAWSRPDQPVIVRGGEVRLAQVALNLISNAIDAMADCEPKRVEVAVRREPGRAVLEVRDTGPGIAEPEKIFDPFYSTKASGAGGGMGLGLSISYGLVQSFGGVIRGRNAPGAGAIFTVELALSEAEVAA
ncbi:ATP-binding protein [Pseudoroseicyclus sp. CXY001]|uniref:sensor histidine kinase n=1 Tax=Pseudoroseicyclus sp. CXY001 TaxID=3242492 RepID=UPI0035709BE1